MGAFLCLITVPHSQAADKKPAAIPAVKETKNQKREMTPDELRQYLIETLDHEAEVFSFIPELKKEKEGVYTYKGKKVEDLDNEQLQGVFKRVQNEIVRIRTERLNRQLESIRQAQQAITNAQRASRPSAAPTPPPQPPQQIKIPQPPQTPPAPPKIPAPPPQPPRRN